MANIKLKIINFDKKYVKRRINELFFQKTNNDGYRQMRFKGSEGLDALPSREAFLC